MEKKLQNQNTLAEGLRHVTSENLAVLKKQMVQALNEAEQSIHAINRELERRGEK